MERLIQITIEVLGHFEQHKDEYLFACPKCKHHKKKLSLNFNRNMFKCWVCEYSGLDIIHLIKRYGSYDQLREYKSLTTKNDDLLNSLLFNIENNKKIKRTTKIPDNFKFIFSGAPKYVYNWLKKTRGLIEEDIFKWKIGFCEHGRCAHRVVVPSFNTNGFCNYYVARDIENKFQVSYLLPEDVKKHDIIFNEININWEKPIYITEGVFDAIKLGDNSIPIMGKTFSNNSLLLEKIILYDPLVYLCLDSDRTNNGITNRSIQLADKMLQFGVSKIEIIDPFPYKDFGEIPRNEIEAFKSKSERIENKFDLLQKELEQLELRMEM